MGWFDEQIRQRESNDEKLFKDSFENAAEAVLGHGFAIGASSDTLGSILAYYHMKPVEIPEEITEESDKLDYICHRTGLMRRRVSLSSGWQKDAFGPMLGFEKEGETTVALLPRGLGGYVAVQNGVARRVTPKVAEELSADAYCFYRPLPGGKISCVDLVRFALRALSPFDIALCAFLALAAAQIGLLLPKLNYFLFSEVFTLKSVSLLATTCLFMLSIRLSSMIMSTVKQMFDNRISVKMSMATQTAAMMRTISLPASFFRGTTTAEVSARLNAVSSLCTMLTDALFTTGVTGLFSLSFISQLFVYSPALVLPSLLVLVLNPTLSIIASFRRMKLTKQRLEASAKCDNEALSLVTGIQKIKLTGSEKRFFARWSKALSHQVRLLYNPPAFLKLSGVITTAVSLAGQLVVYALAYKSSMSVAAYYAYTNAYSMVAGAFASLASLVMTFASVKPTLDMAKPILDAEPETVTEKGDLSSLSGAVELSHVSFRYDENTPYVLRDFSLSVRPGEYVAVVGRTGCGKSTLVRLLLGFEKPDSGAVYYDGRDLESLDKRGVRRRIGTVMQDDKLFQGSVFSNITITNPTMTEDEAWEAAEIASIAEDIRDMPMGMHTIITEGSGGISGGQRQRLLIARAIARKPKLLIFDEATSALDNIAQQHVARSLEKLGCTRIVIAHRLSTVQKCDRILYLEDGNIREEGNFETLMEKKGKFYELVKRQLADA